MPRPLFWICTFSKFNTPSKNVFRLCGSSRKCCLSYKTLQRKVFFHTGHEWTRHKRLHVPSTCFCKYYHSPIHGRRAPFLQSKSCEYLSMSNTTWPVVAVRYCLKRRSHIDLLMVGTSYTWILEVRACRVTCRRSGLRMVIKPTDWSCDVSSWALTNAHYRHAVPCEPTKM